MTALDRLRDDAHRFSLFAALRLLEQEHSGPRFGESRRPQEDAVRLHQPPHLTFAPADLAGVGSTETGAARLEQLCFGVFGPNGALPLHLTEYAFERAVHFDDPAVADFVNAFQHRFVGLFYRAWADGEPTVNLDRPRSDRFVRTLGALVGLAPPAARAASPLAAAAALGRAALFGRGHRSAAALECALSDYFGLTVTVRQFVGGWLDIPDESRLRLGTAVNGLGLGMGATLGARSWQCQHQFEIGAGPLDYPAFVRLLPGTPGFEEMAGIVRFFTGEEWAWSLRPTLAAGEAPRAQLGRTGSLGWTTWLGGRAAQANDVSISGARALSGGHREIRGRSPDESIQGSQFHG